MIHKDSERHEAFGVKEFNNNNNNKRRTHHESNLFYVSNVSSGGFAGAQRACSRFFTDDG
jgi:predicted RNA-binding protein with PUA-like domain